MAGRTTYYNGLTRQGNVQLDVETTTATFPAYLGIVATAEGLPSSYYYFSLQRDPRFNSVSYPTEFFDDIETALGITLVDNDVFIATPIQNELTKEQKQVQKLEIASATRAADGLRSVYDISELPTKYSGNTVVDNLNSGGLVQGRPWASSETPNLFSGLAIWYDTALASTINGGTFSDGTTLATLTNRATNTNGAPASLGREPTVQNGAGDTLNGYPVIRFSTASTYDNIRFTTDAFDNITGWTVVMLAKTVVAAGFNSSLFMITSSGATALTGIRYTSASSQFTFVTPVGSASVDGNIDPDGTWKIISVRYDSTAAAASRCTFRWAKTARTVTNGGTAPSGITTDTPTYVETMSAWDGDLAEQIAYNRALTDDEIIALEDYLSSKWGV
jgi:hypothetical protein